MGSKSLSHLNPDKFSLLSSVIPGQIYDGALNEVANVHLMSFSFNYEPTFKHLTQHNLKGKMSPNKEKCTSYPSLVITQVPKDTTLSTQY
jgi:hypothetical protein